MNRTSKTRMAAGFILLLVMLVSSPAGASQHASTTAESDQIDAWIDDRLAAHGIPGAAVAVVRDGEVIHLSGYGSADGDARPVTPQTPFLVGSVSKPFTAVVVTQLVEEGRLAWDEPVWPHLSEMVREAPAGFERVTVEQLLTHRGGLGMSVGMAGAVEIHHGPDALDRRVADVLSQPLAGSPGDKFEYSNAGAMLLAAVSEEVTGQSFADQLRERVFDPLGMSDSFASEEGVRDSDVATGHELWFGRWRPANLRYDPAGVAMGYIGASATDMVGFMRAHLDGDPALPATARDIASGPVTPTGWDTPLDGGYGRGWFVDEFRGNQVVSHTGSLGHFAAHVLLVPEEDLGIAVLANASAFVAAGHEAQYDLGFGLTSMLLGEDPQPTDRGALMTLVLPLAAWGALALLIVSIGRYLFQTIKARALPTPAVKTTASGWVSLFLPGVVFLAAGVGLVLMAPLGVARHFYPDVGWAVTLIAYLSCIWGALRLVLATYAGLRRGGSMALAPPRWRRSRRSVVGA